MGGLQGPQTGENDRRYIKARGVYAAGFVELLKATARTGAQERPMERRAELTLRGFVLGAAITLVFTAANVYL